MRWLDETDFGYYAVCPEPYLKDWDGTEADAVAGEYVGRITLPGAVGGDVLTLGGEPLPVAYHAPTMTFVRWIAADDDRGLEDAVERAARTAGWQDAGVEVTLGGRYVVLDSAARGDEVGEADVLRLNVQPGRYRVGSLVITPAEDTEFMLERLTRL
ncbi:Imm21 family immunity protein [Streptomyces sp. NPDC047928]|uniref:Imm21 family immunity protein n=1 Tax=unclassified Streptomyces TaxID=2593676 RepID=UPI0037177C23